jgi:hypothetical protein
MRIARTLLISSAAVVTGVALFAQGRNIGNDWPTALGDAQRTNWLRSDPNISVESLAKPGFELQWKAGLEGQRGLKPAVQGVTVNGVTLFTPLSIVTGANDVIAIDNDTGETFWYKSFGAAPAGSGPCAAAAVPQRAVAVQERLLRAHHLEMDRRRALRRQAHHLRVARRGRQELRPRQGVLVEAVAASAVRPASCMRLRATACCTS